MPDILNDSLDDLIGGAGEVRSEPVRAPVDYVPGAGGRPNKFKDVKEYVEKCTKCAGTGRYRGFSRHGGECFECGGIGSKTFRTSPDQRAKSRASASARKATVEQASVEGFKAAHQAAYEWLVATAPRWELAESLLGAVHRYGSLTDKQMAIVTNGIARDAARAQERAARVADAPAVDGAGIDRLKEAFNKARAYAAEKGLKLKVPKITIGGITISPAGAQSKNPGALYVKDAGVYVGKIAGGRFHAANANGADVAAKVQAFITNPAEAAKVYGQTTGVCCVCNAVLKSKWKLRGIGPICAEKMGWSGLAEDFGVDL